MSAVGIISGLENNLIDDPTGCKVKIGYSNYDFKKYSDYTMKMSFDSSSTVFTKVLTESDMTGGTITWDLGIGSLLYTNRIASRILLLMQSLQKLEYHLTIQAKDSSEQIYSDVVDGVFETSSANSAPTFDGISSASEMSILLNSYMNGVHVKGISYLQIVPSGVSSSSYRNFSKNAGSGTSDLLIASIGYGDNQVSSDNLVLEPNDCGNQQISLTLYDSRGYGTTKTTDILVYDRSPSYIEDTSAIDRVRSDSSTTGVGIDIHGYYSAIRDSSSNLVNRPYIWYKFGFNGTAPSTSYNVGNWIVYNPSSTSWYIQSTDGYFSLSSSSFDSITTNNNPVSFANAYLDYDIYMEFAVCDKLQGLDWVIGGTGEQLDEPPTTPDDTQHFDILKYTPTVALRSGKVGINKRNPQSAVDIVGDVTLAGDLNWTLSSPSSHANQALGTDSSGNVGWRSFPSAPVTSVDGDTGDVVLNDVKYSIQSKTDSEKTQARSNIGAASASDLSSHTGNSTIHVTASDKSTWNAKYDKPSGGIPDSDLATSYVPTSQKAAANGVATLNNNGKIPMEQLDDAIAGNLKFQDVWNASTNTPTLPSVPAYADKGKYWITTVAGTFQSVTYNIGDWIVSNWTGDESTGSGSWRRVPNTDAVSSVNSKTGAVVLTASDVGAVSTSGYVATDNNFTTALKNKLDGIDTSLYLPKAGGTMSGELQMGTNDISGVKDLGAQKLSASSGVYGLNLYYQDGSSFKNVKDELSNKVSTSGYVATDNNFTTALKNKLDGIDTSLYLPKAGGTMSGDIDCDSNDIENVSTLGATTIGATTISANAITGRYLKYTDIDLQTHDVQEEIESKADSSDLPVANPGETATGTLTKLKVNGVVYSVDSGGGTTITEVFIATYSSSTHADMLTAYNAGKVVICKYMGREYYLQSIASNTNGYFVSFTTTPAMYVFSVSSANVWSTVSSISLAKASDYLALAGGTMTGDINMNSKNINQAGTISASTGVYGLDLFYQDGSSYVNVKTALASKAESSSIPTALSDLSTDTTHRVVTDAEKTVWNAKATVDPNPTGVTTGTTLNFIKINGSNYSIPGASGGLPTTGGTMTGDITFNNDSSEETLSISNSGYIKATVTGSQTRGIIQYNNGSTDYSILTMILGVLQLGRTSGLTQILSSAQPTWSNGSTSRNILVANTAEASSFGNADYQKVIVNGDGTRTLYIKKSFDVTEINATGGMYWGDAGYISQYLGISGSHEDFNSIISISQSAIFESGGSGYATNAYTWLGAVYTSPTNSKCIPNLYLGRGTNGKLKGTYFITIVGT